MLLAAAFLTQDPRLFILAALPLGLAVIMFTVAAGLTLWRLPVAKTTRTMAYAVTGLAVALVLGLIMAVQRGVGRSLTALLLSAHPLWALTGGLFVLWIGVALQVLPMFQGVRPWPARAALWLGPTVLGLLVETLVAGAFHVRVLARAGQFAVAGVVGACGILVFQRLWTRTRRRADVMTYFWYTGLGSLLLASLLNMVMTLGVLHGSRWPLVLGILAILGAAVSFIAGMLYKIVPFLVWLHLQRSPSARAVLMSSVISERSGRYHLVMHSAALGVTVLAAFQPSAVAAAGALWVLCGAVFGMNVWHAGRFYAIHAESLGSVHDATL